MRGRGAGVRLRLPAEAQLVYFCPTKICILICSLQKSEDKDRRMLYLEL